MSGSTLALLDVDANSVKRTDFRLCTVSLFFLCVCVGQWKDPGRIKHCVARLPSFSPLPVDWAIRSQVAVRNKVAATKVSTN